MAQCQICGTEMSQGRGRARRTCSPACRQAAHRRRQAEQVAALRAAAARPAPALAPPVPAPVELPVPDDSPAGHIRAAGAQLLAAVEAAAWRAAQDWDTDTSGALPGHRRTTPEDAVTTVRALAEQAVAAILASAPKTSRNEPTPVAPAAPAAAALARPEPTGPASPGPSRNEPAPEPTIAPEGIPPRPQKLPRSQAFAIADAATLVRGPDHRDNHRWILRSGDTVLGHVEPSYGGASRSGRNGWISRLGGTPGPRCKSRNGAAMDLASRWVRVVTSPPKRTITGD
ncbi:hypothetical protein [Streptomyces sp. NPDC002758]